MPIAVHKTEWDRIRGWTDTSKEESDATRRREYIKNLDEASRAMSSEWPNSLENVNKRNEELRRARNEMAEQVNSRFYKKYMKRKDAEQKQMLYSARDTVFKHKDAPKLLRSAVIESVSLKERELQVEFQKERQREKDQEKKEYEDDIIRKAAEWHKMQDDQKAKRKEKNTKVAQEVAEQAKEDAERARLEHEAELKMQMEDNLRADAEMKALEQFEKEQRKLERDQIYQRGEESLKDLENRRRQQAARDKMDDELIEVLNRSKARIEARRKETEIEIREEKQAILRTISANLNTLNMERTSITECILAKAIAEYEANQSARERADLEKKERQKQEMIEEKNKYMRKKEEELRDLKNIKQWELMNQIKNQEVYEAYLEEQKKEKVAKVAQFREDIIKQWHEDDARIARNKAEIRKFYGEDALKKMRLEDNKLLTYAEALILEAELNKRSTRPIKKAVERYCKMNRLIEMPPLYKSLQEVFPDYKTRDLTRPDSSYVPSRPPPPVPPQDVDDPEDDLPEYGRRDGVCQDREEAPAPKEKKKEKASDFARAAPANGLQRPPSGFDPTLDKVCTNLQCDCRLSLGRKMK